MPENDVAGPTGRLSPAEISALLARLKGDLDALALNPGNLEMVRLRAEVEELAAEIESGREPDAQKVTSVHSLLAASPFDVIEFKAASYLAELGRMLGLD